MSKIFTVPSGQTLHRRDYSRSGSEDLDLSTLRISPAGFCGQICKNGHIQPSYEREEFKNLPACTICGEPKKSDELAVLERDVAFLQDPEAVRSRSWWMFSEVSSFMEDPRTEPVHVGSLEAAHERESHFVKNPGFLTADKAYVYEFKLKPSAVISSAAFVESTLNYGHHEILSIACGGQVVRYVNRQEDIGSISLLTVKKNLEIINRVDASWRPPSE